MFQAPKSPPIPDEGDIAQDLKSYEDQQVEVEGQGEPEPPEEPWYEEGWFEDDVEGKAPASH